MTKDDDIHMLMTSRQMLLKQIDLIDQYLITRLSYEDLAKMGHRILAMKVYQKSHGCTLKEALSKVDEIKGGKK